MCKSMGSSCSSHRIVVAPQPLSPVPQPPAFVCQQVAALRSFLEAALNTEIVHDDRSLQKHTANIHPNIMAAMDSSHDAEAFLKGLFAGWRCQYAPFPKETHDDMMVVLKYAEELERKTKDNAERLCDLLDRIVGDE